MLKKILFILDKKQKKDFYFLSFYNFVNSLLEIVGVISLSVIVLIVLNPHIYLEKLNDFFIYKYALSLGFNQLKNLGFSLYFFSFIFLITAIIKFLIKYYSIKFSINLSLEVSNIIYKNYLNTKYIHLFDATSSKLLNLANYHSYKFSNSIINPILNLVGSFSLILILLISFLFIGGIKTILSLAFIFIICLIIYLFLNKRIATNEKQIIQSDINRQNLLNESFNNIKYLKLSKKYFKLLDKYKFFGLIFGKALKFNQTSLHLAKPILEISFLVIAIAFVTVNLSAENHNLIEHLPIISFFLLSFYRMIPSIQVMYQSIVHIKGSLGTLNYIQEELNKKNLQEILLKNEELENVDFNRSITLDKIDFNYPNGKKLFSNISLEIEKNTCVAFFGKSGEGKTTIVDIICTLMDPDKGNILLDDVKINEKNKLSYQNKIGYLSQNFYIINDTLINNATFYDFNRQKNNEKAKKILFKLFEESEIKNLINSEEKIGENGIKLSQGQRQRLIIVRLLYENKEILILDEPTSSIDKNNIIKLKDIIQDLKKTKTIILTSHNKEILKVCDKIFMVQNGQVKHVLQNELIDEDNEK